MTWVEKLKSNRWTVIKGLILRRILLSTFISDAGSAIGCIAIKLVGDTN